jgi:hypothetical protein
MNFIKKNWIYILFGLSVLFFVYKKYIYHPHNQIKVTTFQTSLGWGYNISVNDSIIIHQNIIPGVQGYKGFTTQSDAAKVGNMVLDKIKNKQLPSVTLQELDNLHIDK